jgi:hypothetical protein
MHQAIHMAWVWATKPEDRFMDFLLLCGLVAGIVLLGTSVYDAWKADLPWMGWDLRRRKLWRSSGRRPH